ncbi:hypothetical protein DPV78_011615, partial [Talaromyces pinophilus]
NIRHLYNSTLPYLAGQHRSDGRERVSHPLALKTTGLKGSTNLPVYVNIHGGGFGFGAASDPIWDPTRLVRRSLADGKPFLAVNINYRLGIFGFGISSDLIDVQRKMMP